MATTFIEGITLGRQAFWSDRAKASHHLAGLTEVEQ